MKSLNVCFVILLTLLGCNKSEDIVSISDNENTSNGLSITYGTEKTNRRVL